MIRAAIIGAGNMGRTHAEAYKEMQDVELVAVMDKNEEKGREFKDTFSCEYVSDFEELLRNDKPDLIDICLPTNFHEEYIVKASKHVKNIICEKPISLSMEAFLRILNAVRENDARLYVAQVLRFWEEYVLAKKMYEEGVLGDIRFVEAKRLSVLPVWSAWYKDVKSSGGGLFDLHLHDVDFLAYIFGRPELVYAGGYKTGSGAWNFVSTSLNFKNDIFASAQGIIEMSENYPFTMKLCMVGDKASLEYEMKAGKNLENIDAAVRNTRLYSEKGIESIDIKDEDAYKKELEHFVSCIRENRCSDIVSLQSVCDTMAVMEAIKKSLETKKAIVPDYKNIGE